MFKLNYQKVHFSNIVIIIYKTWFPEMLVCRDITVVTSCIDLAVAIQIGSILHSNSYYTVVAGILVPNATSCKTIHGVKSVRN